MTWNFDIKSAPRGRYEVKQRREGVDLKVFVPEKVILATKCRKITVSHYLPDEKRWMMLGHGEQPVAWMAWPEYPNLSSTASPAAAADVAGNDLREPATAASGQIIREGDAPRETDCQAGEASQGGSDASSPDTDPQTAEPTAGPWQSPESQTPAAAATLSHSSETSSLQADTAEAPSSSPGVSATNLEEAA